MANDDDLFTFHKVLRQILQFSSGITRQPHSFYLDQYAVPSRFHSDESNQFLDCRAIRSSIADALQRRFSLNTATYPAWRVSTHDRNATSEPLLHERDV